jgi:hypothetical protein
VSLWFFVRLRVSAADQATIVQIPARTADDRTYDLDFDNPPPSVVDPVERYIEIDRVEVVKREK